MSRLRGALSAGVTHTDPELSPPRRGGSRDPWPESPPLDALAGGGQVPVCWYGQQDGSWIAYYDMLQRPAAVHTEPVPGTWHDEIRLHARGVRYRDGWRSPAA